MRLDSALAADLRLALASRPIRFFLLLQLAAAAVFVIRRGGDTVTTVALIWVGMLVLAFFAWWAGRDAHAVQSPDDVPASRPRAVFALLAAGGMLAWSLNPAIGSVLFACGAGGWIWSAWRAGGLRGVGACVLRDPRPFVPLMLVIAVPRLIIGGPGYLVGAALALPSGIGQQLLYLLGLFAPLEAVRQRTAMAAVAAALVFGTIHLPLVMTTNADDVIAALANVVLFQSSVGLIACLAFVRHRAAVPIGVAHALAIG